MMREFENYKVVKVDSTATALLLSFVMIMESDRKLSEGMVDLFNLYEKTKLYFDSEERKLI